MRHSRAKARTSDIAKVAPVLLICGGALLLVINDALAKSLVDRFDPFQILFLRSLIALPVLAVLLIRRQPATGFRTSSFPLYVVRSVLGIAATWTFITSLADLPLAEATTILFLAPIFVVALAAPLLGEKVGILRAGALVLGLLGALIILDPTGVSPSLAALLAFAAAVFNAGVMLSARFIDRSESFLTMTFYTTLLFVLLCSFTIFTTWPPLTPGDIPRFCGLALAGTLGVVLITQAFRMGEASLVAPFDYTALLWACLIGWLVWGDVPGARMLGGAVLIVAGGMLLVLFDSPRPANPGKEQAKKANSADVAD